MSDVTTAIRRTFSAHPEDIGEPLTDPSGRLGVGEGTGKELEGARKGMGMGRDFVPGRYQDGTGTGTGLGMLGIPAQS